MSASPRRPGRVQDVANLVEGLGPALGPGFSPDASTLPQTTARDDTRAPGRVSDTAVSLPDTATEAAAPTALALPPRSSGPWPTVWSLFGLPASKMLPKIMQSKKDTIGLRVPDNRIAQAIIEELGRPILSASLPGEMVEDYTDPEVMFANFHNEVDFVIDGGIGGMIPSTVVDCTGDEPVVTRKGLGEWED